MVGGVAYSGYLIPFLQQWEGFSPAPYWDVNRWAWGYGTRVPGSSDNKNLPPDGSIDRATAYREAANYIEGDYNYLKNIITAPLNPRQWAALLSFSYNLGRGNAANLVANINAGDDLALGYQWNEYVYSGGQINSNLVARRAAEWQLYIS